MNIQQLRYIVAIDRFRNFARAAEACKISQPTLSAMLVKLEEELEVRIFERNNRSVMPTAAGEKIVRQAQKALMETDRITELVNIRQRSYRRLIRLVGRSYHRTVHPAQIHSPVLRQLH